MAGEQKYRFAALVFVSLVLLSVLAMAEANGESIRFVGSPTACSWGEKRIDIFIGGSDGALWHKWYDAQTWHDWESLGGNLTSDPVAASWGPNRIDVFARSKDNTLRHKWLDEQGWHSWESFSGTITSDPAAVSWGPNRIDVFAVGVDGSLWQKYYSGNWSDFSSLGYLPSGAVEGGQKGVPGQNQPAGVIEGGQKGGQGHITIPDKVPPKDVGIKKVEAILPTTGALSVTTSPTAYVSVDGVSKGKYDGHVPITVDNLAPGPHTVVISECGYLSYEATVTIEAGSTKEFHCNLRIDKAVSTCPPDTVPPSGSGTKKGEQIPVTATLWVKSNPSGAEVSVDGVSRGIFSGQFCCGEPLIISNLSSGPHTVRCRLTGYQDYESKLTLNDGDYQGVDCKLIPGTSTLSPAKTGTLHIYPGDYSGAEVSIDGVPMGTIPLTVPDLSPGPHTIRWWDKDFQKYREITRTVQVGDNPIELHPYAEGTVSITSSPCCAEVLVDEVQNGTAPVTINTVPGSHTIRCRLAGYSDYEGFFKVDTDRTTNVLCNLLPIAPEAVAGDVKEMQKKGSADLQQGSGESPSSVNTKLGSTRENPLPYNTPVDLGDGWQIQVIQFWAQQPPNCTTAMTGEDCLIFFATIEARYTGTGSAIFDASRLKAVGNSSVAYNQFDRSSINWDLTGPSLLPSAEVFKGGSIQGTVCWEIKLSDVSDVPSLVMYDGNKPSKERVYISLSAGLN